MPSPSGAPGRRAHTRPRIRHLVTLPTAGPRPWPDRIVLDLGDGRAALAIPEGGSHTRIGQPVAIDDAVSQARSVLAGAGSGMPTLLFQLALALVATSAQVADRAAAAMDLVPEDA